MKNNIHNLYAAAFVLGFFILGLYIYKGFRTFQDKDRVVSVKGLAELEMTATHSQIDVNFAFSGDDLKSLIKSTEEKKNTINSYLQGLGFKEIKLHPIDVYDRQSYFEYEWNDGKRVQVKADRYRVTQYLSFIVNEVEKTVEIASNINLHLIQNNLTSTIETQYSFPELNTIKPQLIAESTKNARIAGEQFANDSKAKIGKIKTASQGQISIIGDYYYGDDERPTKPTDPFKQKVRVVSAIVFYLE